MFDGITVRKWFDILTDEEPTRPSLNEKGSEHYKAKPNRCHEAMVSTDHL